MALQLQTPDWPAALPNCQRCGYSLHGLTLPCECPECGAPADQNPMVLWGVLQRNVAVSPWRRFAWAFIIVIGVVVSYTWSLAVLLGFYAIIALLSILVALIASTVALLKTSSSDGSGRHMIVFGKTGISATADLNDTNPSGQVTVWQAVSHYEMKRVSRVWYKLIVYNTSGGKAINAGVRCNDQDAQRVSATINAYLDQTKRLRQTNPPLP